MEAVIGLLLMLLGVSHGVETCDGRQDGAQCYGALGGSVVLQLMDSASEIFRYQLFSNNTQILAGRKNQILSNVIEDRSSFTPSDGKFRINKLSRTDGGEYTLEIFDSNGTRSERRTLHLIIQAPVSSVQLVSECLSQGEMRVSCSAEEGDSPQYSWTLDGLTLTDAQLLSGNSESKSITLKGDVSGQLVCSVRNNVSRFPTCDFVFPKCTLPNGMHVLQRARVSADTLCVEPTTTLITETQASTEDRSQLICGVRAAVVILLLIGITVYFLWKKKKYQTAEGSADPRTMKYQENSVVMVEMRSSAAEV